MTTVGVLVVDDKPSFRRAAAAVIEMTEGFVHVGDAIDGESALALAAELHPDLVLVDVHMPGMSGVTAARTLRDRGLARSVVLVSTYEPTDLPADVRTSGLRYLHKARLAPETLQRAWSAGHEPASTGDDTSSDDDEPPRAATTQGQP